MLFLTSVHARGGHRQRHGGQIYSKYGGQNYSKYGGQIYSKCGGKKNGDKKVVENKWWFKSSLKAVVEKRWQKTVVENRWLRNGG